MSRFRAFAGVLVSLLLTACATQAPPIVIPDIDRSAAVQVRDLRPAKEKEAETFSFNVANSAYGLARVGDEKVSPPSLRVLQHRAFEKLGAGVTSIDVHHLVVYRNMQSWGRRVAMASAAGAVGGAVVGGTATVNTSGGSSVLDPSVFSSVGNDEWKLALFKPSEDPGPAISYIVYLDAEIQGKRVVTKTIRVSTDNNIHVAIPLAVESAIAFNLSQHGK
jgi:hypothetical protein